MDPDDLIEEIANVLDSGEDIDMVEEVEAGEIAPEVEPQGQDEVAPPPPQVTENTVAPHNPPQEDGAYSELIQALNARGFNGNDPVFLADCIRAQGEGKTVEEYRATLAHTKNQQEDLVKQSPAYKQALAEKEQLENVVFEKVVEGDTRELKRLFPDFGVKSVLELGEPYINARKLGMSNEDAYSFYLAQQAKKEKPIPPKVGVVHEQRIGEKSYYTSEEVDRLSESELNNPTIINRVKESMKKWGRK